ncbi:MAG: hypothetical protein ACKVH5_02780, partial [Fidelibacterota bacterium]
NYVKTPYAYVFKDLTQLNEFEKILSNKNEVRNKRLPSDISYFSNKNSPKFDYMKKIPQEKTSMFELVKANNIDASRISLNFLDSSFDSLMVIMIGYRTEEQETKVYMQKLAPLKKQYDSDKITYKEFSKLKDDIKYLKNRKVPSFYIQKVVSSDNIDIDLKPLLSKSWGKWCGYMNESDRSKYIVKLLTGLTGMNMYVIPYGSDKEISKINFIDKMMEKFQYEALGRFSDRTKTISYGGYMLSNTFDSDRYDQLSAISYDLAQNYRYMGATYQEGTDRSLGYSGRKTLIYKTHEKQYFDFENILPFFNDNEDKAFEKGLSPTESYYIVKSIIGDELRWENKKSLEADRILPSHRTTSANIYYESDFLPAKIIPTQLNWSFTNEGIFVPYYYLQDGFIGLSFSSDSLNIKFNGSMALVGTDISSELERGDIDGIKKQLQLCNSSHNPFSISENGWKSSFDIGIYKIEKVLGELVNSNKADLFGLHYMANQKYNDKLPEGKLSDDYLEGGNNDDGYIYVSYDLSIIGNEKIKGSIKDAQVYFPTEITLKKK